MITLGVADVAASTAFYEKLGFEKSSASQEEVTFFRLKGTALGLFGRADRSPPMPGVEDSKPGFSGVTIAHNLGSEAEVDEAFAHALACGATEVEEAGEGVLGRLFGLFRRSRRASVGAGLQPDDAKRRRRLHAIPA